MKLNATMGGFVLAGKNKRNNIIKMKKRQNPWAGIILILFSVYIIVLFVQSLHQDNISIYEVTQNKLADDDTIRGVILRDEHLVKAKESGYINYYVGEGARVGVNTTIYSVDRTGGFNDSLDKVGADDYSLSDEDTKTIRADIAEYRADFEFSNYEKITNFRYNLDNSLLKMTTAGLLKKANSILRKNTSASFGMIKSGKTGIVSFCSDGLEKLNIDSVNQKTFYNTTDKWKQLRQKKKISKGETAYKLITSDNWSVVIPLTRKQYKKIFKKDSISVVIKKDNNRLKPSVMTFTENSKYYAKLEFNKDMINYIDNRYLDIQLEFDESVGLKVPVSSIIKKKFYIIPNEYITHGGDDESTGVMLKTYDKHGNRHNTFKKVKVYYKDKKNRCYIDARLFSAGDIIVADVSANGREFSLTRTARLDGVYYCNNGYCTFKRIEIKYSNSEYVIVPEDSIYGLQIYDHIILNPSLVKEDEII